MLVAMGPGMDRAWEADARSIERVEENGRGAAGVAPANWSGDAWPFIVLFIG